MQRIPRYNLLLKELLKHTLEDDPSYEELSAALRDIEKLAEYVNTKIKDTAMKDKMLEISLSISDLSFVRTLFIFLINHNAGIDYSK